MMWIVGFVICYGVHYVNSFTSSLFYGFGNEFEYLTRELNESIATFDSGKIETSWIEQPLDHFNSEDKRTWKMRYFERHDLWKPGKPIYLFLGGEGPASPSFIQTGIMFDLAKETGGALYSAEHRYYGRSKPFEDFTAKNLEFLSSRQALADYAVLLKTIKESLMFNSSKVVVVGGSYSGNLAAWMKLMYPEIVDVAIASSAPVLAKKDFYEYLEVVSADFEEYGTVGCWDHIALKFSEYERYFKSEKGIEILKEEENICESCNMSRLENQQIFFMDKASRFMSLAQYGNTSLIQKYCEMNFPSDFWKLNRRNILRTQKNDCISYDFDDMIAEVKNDDSYQAWIYQTCTEFGYFQTGSSDNQPFTKNLPVDLYDKMCIHLFGPEFNGERVAKGVEETNKMYGGLSPNVKNVVFVNGDMDPWSALSVLEDISYDAPAKVIPRSSHCRDLFSDKDYDPEELKEARRYVRYLIKSWIGEK